MNKNLLIQIFIYITFASYCKAQDLIVTDKGDSLNCKITDIKESYIYFTYKADNEIRSTLLPVWQIPFYKQNYFPQPDLTLKVPENSPEYVANKTKKAYAKKGDYKSVRINFDGGFSYSIVKLSKDLDPFFDDYFKKLKSGRHLGGDFGYFISESFGLGLRYSNFNTKNELKNVIATNSTTGQVKSGNISDNITINYFGPNMFLRYTSKDKMRSIIGSLSLGYMGYKDKVVFLGEKYSYTGGALGSVLKLEADFMIDRNIALGIGFGYIGGSLGQVEETYKSKTTTIKFKVGEFESLARIDLSVGLKIYL